jgi:DNA-binding LacI/PurR family transcriptional regulator
MGDSEHGRRRPTMIDVARQAGVSRALVSVVFRDAPGASDETRRRVLRAAEELGYQRDDSARALRSGRSHLLGVVFESRDDFHADLLDACYRAAEPHGYELLLSAVTASRSQDRAVETLLASRVAGIVVFGSGAPPEVLAGYYGRIPVVVVGHHEGDGVDVVRTDENQGIRQAVDHLIERGHRHIACVEATGHQSGAARVAAYRAVMAERGLGDLVRVLPGGFTHLHGIGAARRLVAEAATDVALPTAVLASNDLCAAGLLHGLRAAGVDVPGRVSVIGFDGSRTASMPDVMLTTVAQNADGLAKMAVAVLIDRAAASGASSAPSSPSAQPPSPPQQHVFAPQLVVRGTTAAAATAGRATTA